MADIWVTVNEQNTVINRFEYEKGQTPIQINRNHIHVKSSGKEQIGWTYNNNKFISPPEDYTTKIELPKMEPTPEQKQIADLKADVQTLSASLTQVINTLNNLTRPTSAGKNNPAK